MPKRRFGFSRREFLAASLGCLASVGKVESASSHMSVAGGPVGSDKTGTTPTTRILGRTGLEVPIVGVGAGAGADPGLIQTCVEKGMKLFDTDVDYQNGNHEQMLGRVFRRMGARDKVIIMTKVHAAKRYVGSSAERSKQALYRTFEGSLRRLQTECVDILLLPDVDSSGPILNEAIVEAMTRVKEEGKARFIGVATHANMTAVINAAVGAKVFDVVLTSLNFTMVDDTALLGAVANAAEAGLGVIAMKTQAGGGAFPDPKVLREYSRAVINSAALKWVCNNDNVATSIPGFANYDHLRANFAVAVNPAFTDEERRFLADRKVRLGLGFCRQCRTCLASCPKSVAVPALMRTHMYARQYADFARARHVFNSIPRQAGLGECTSCDECVARCAHSVNIPHKIAELKMLYA